MLIRPVAKGKGQERVKDHLEPGMGGTPVIAGSARYRPEGQDCEHCGLYKQDLRDPRAGEHWPPVSLSQHQSQSRY